MILLDFTCFFCLRHGFHTVKNAPPPHEFGKYKTESPNSNETHISCALPPISDSKHHYTQNRTNTKSNDSISRRGWPCASPSANQMIIIFGRIFPAGDLGNHKGLPLPWRFNILKIVQKPPQPCEGRFPYPTIPSAVGAGLVPARLPIE